MPDSIDSTTRNVQHVRIEIFQSTAGFTAPGRKQSHKPLRDDYAAHADQLLTELVRALGSEARPSEEKLSSIKGLKPGSLIQIETRQPTADSAAIAKIPPGFQFKDQDIVILRSERDERSESAVVFVPDDARNFLQARLKGYGRDPGNSRRPDVEKFELIERISRADGASLFSPALKEEVLEPVWWEVWVREPHALADRVATAAADQFGLVVHADRLIFPETIVLHIHATSASILDFVSRVPGAFAEVRRATDTINIFLEHGRSMGLGPADHVADLEARVLGPPPDGPVVCILDSGVAAAHPLLAKGLKGSWAYDEAWGTDDHEKAGGHGTGMAGLVLYGDLFACMADQRELTLTHGVESMKYLTPPGFQKASVPSYGAITQGAVAMVELNGGIRQRSYCIASSTDLVSPSRPSSWSGALDQLAAGSTSAERVGNPRATQTPKRLILVAAGNVIGGQRSEVVQKSCIEDPSQSWNALTIGGYTTKDSIDPFELGSDTVVLANDVSPFSCGSNRLPADLTPIKPEVLFEAGNMRVDGSDFCGSHPSLSLLALGSDVHGEPLLPFHSTSAAAGVAGNFLGRLKAELPGLWPETYRALTVHSAEWIGPMKQRLIGAGDHWRVATKGSRQEALREMGYGVPNFDRAIRSAQNDLVLLAQSEIQPYAKPESGGQGIFNEIHFYDLPWPRTALEELENEVVTMKVTLSYFIEPNLSGRAATRPETYRSFGLRFAMKRRTESRAAFKKRYAAALAAEKIPAVKETDCWLLGPKAIAAGSIHCDLWRGRAVDLAGHDSIAVFPVSGWWKTLVRQRRMIDKARYALAISIDARGQSVNLETEIAQQVAAKQIEIDAG